MSDNERKEVATAADWQRLIDEWPEQLASGDLITSDGLYCAVGYMGHIQGFTDQQLKDYMIHEIGIYGLISDFWKIHTGYVYGLNDCFYQTETNARRAIRMKNIIMLNYGAKG